MPEHNSQETVGLVLSAYRRSLTERIKRAGSGILWLGLLVALLGLLVWVGLGEEGSDLFIGAVSGVLGAGVLWVLGHIIEDTIIPHAQDITIEGDYSGEWRIWTSGLQGGQLELTQTGKRLAGDCLLLLGSNTGLDGIVEEARFFGVQGLLREEVLRLNFDQKRRDRFGYGVMMLEKVRDRRMLVGEMTFASVASAGIHSRPCVFSRPGVSPEDAKAELLRQEKRHWMVPPQMELWQVQKGGEQLQEDLPLSETSEESEH